MVLGWTVLVLSDRKRSDGGRLGIRRRNLVLSTAGKWSDGGRLGICRRNLVLSTAGKRSDAYRLGKRWNYLVLHEQQWGNVDRLAADQRFLVLSV